MNRLDEIKAKALDAAQHITQDPAKREALANDLIDLIGLMVGAVGKYVAVEGESDLNRAEDFADRVSGHTMYLTGERVQDGAKHAVAESMTADLDLYERYGGQPVWKPRCPDCGVRVGMVDEVDYSGGRVTYTHLDHAEDCDTRKSSGITAVEWARRQPGVSDWARAQGFAEFLQPGAEVDAPATACKLCHGPDDHGTDCRDVT